MFFFFKPVLSNCHRNCDCDLYFKMAAMRSVMTWQSSSIYTVPFLSLLSLLCSSQLVQLVYLPFKMSCVAIKFQRFSCHCQYFLKNSLVAISLKVPSLLFCPLVGILSFHIILPWKLRGQNRLVTCSCNKLVARTSHKLWEWSLEHAHNGNSSWNSLI